MTDAFENDPDREVRTMATECQCGHLLASHRAQGCVAVANLTGEPRPPGLEVHVPMCGCTQFRAKS